MGNIRKRAIKNAVPLSRQFVQILMTAAVAQLLLACVSNPNAYKEFDDQFGYTGEFIEKIVAGNIGGVTFTGDETISRQQLRQHCKRRIAELCIANGYDYFEITSANSFSGTAREPVTTWWGTSTDACGNVYNRYRTHYEKIPTYSTAMVFCAYRGPEPSARSRIRYDSAHEILEEYHGSSYKGRKLEERAPAPCAACGGIHDEILVPEHCPDSGLSIFSSVFCPFCHEEVESLSEGPRECAECDEVFRVACCPFCGGRHTLRNFEPFDCAFCDRPTAPGIVTGEEEFYCFHCNRAIGWPDELFGQYECPFCRGLFLVDRCPHCTQPHALLAELPYYCQGCAHWVEYVCPEDAERPCPRCGVVREWPDGPATVGLCFTTMEMVHLVHCTRCSAWLLQAEDRPFFCTLCGTWTEVFRCRACDESLPGHPFDPPEKCLSCGSGIETDPVTD